MRRLSEFPRPFRELYAAHAAFCRLGFDGADLYVGFENVVNHGERTLLLQLNTQGKVFTFCITQLRDATRDDVIRTWLELTDAVMAATDAELDACWRESVIGSSTIRFLELAATLVKRGFEVPFMQRIPPEQRETLTELLGRDIENLQRGGAA